jgi:hypothetical protein
MDARSRVDNFFKRPGGPWHWLVHDAGSEYLPYAPTPTSLRSFHKRCFVYTSLAMNSAPWLMISAKNRLAVSVNGYHLDQPGKDLISVLLAS